MGSFGTTALCGNNAIALYYTVIMNKLPSQLKHYFYSTAVNYGIMNQ